MSSIIKIPATGMPELGEVKDYSPYVRASTQHPAATELNGGVYQGGNTDSPRSASSTLSFNRDI
jgi:hypothetical protein